MIHCFEALQSYRVLWIIYFRSRLQSTYRKLFELDLQSWFTNLLIQIQTSEHVSFDLNRNFEAGLWIVIQYRERIVNYLI